MRSVVSILCCLLLCAGNAYGYIAGQERLGPEPDYTYEGPYDLVATGATFLTCQAGGLLGGGSQCTPNDSATTRAGGMPDNGRIEQAWVIWTMSKQPNVPIDRTLTFTAPGGEALDLEALEEECSEFIDPLDLGLGGLGGGPIDLAWATCRHDVTALMNAHLEGGGLLNGRYEASGLDVEYEEPQMDLLGSVWHLASAVLGSFVFLAVVEPAEATVNRKLYLYNGFQLVEGAENLDLTVQGFNVPPEPAAKLIVHVLEGDEGISGDGLTVNGDPLQNDCNPRNNAFNGTVSVNLPDGQDCRQGTETLDLDEYDISDFLEPRDTEADLRMIVPGGDGILTPGELLFTNFVAVSFDSEPEFIKPTKRSEPGQNTPVRIGDTVGYSIEIVNGGDGDATDVIVTDEVPDGAEYVEGSLRVDDDPGVPHPAGADVSPLEAGFDLTEYLGRPIPNAGEDQRHVVSFQVRVTHVPEGGQLVNVATLDARGIDPVATNRVVHPVLEANEGEGEGEGEGEEGEGEEGEGEGEEGEGEPGEGEGEGEGGEGEEGEGEAGEGEGEEGEGEEGEGEGAQCGPGTVLEDGFCVPDEDDNGVAPRTSGRRGGSGCGCDVSAMPGTWASLLLRR